MTDQTRDGTRYIIERSVAWLMLVAVFAAGLSTGFAIGVLLTVGTT